MFHRAPSDLRSWMRQDRSSTESPSRSSSPSVLSVSVEEWKERNVATVLSYAPTMGQVLARLDHGWTLLHHPGLHGTALPQPVDPLGEYRLRLDGRNVYLCGIHACHSVARAPLDRGPCSWPATNRASPRCLDCVLPGIDRAGSSAAGRARNVAGCC